MPYDEKSFLNGLAAGLTATVTYPKCDACTGNHIVNVEHGVYFFSMSLKKAAEMYFGTGNPADMLGDRQYSEVAHTLVKKRNTFFSGLCSYIGKTGDVTIEKCAFFYGYYKPRNIFCILSAVKATGDGKCFLVFSSICPCGNVIDDITINGDNHKYYNSGTVLSTLHTSGWFVYELRNQAGIPADIRVTRPHIGPIELFADTYTDIPFHGYSTQAVGAKLFSPFKGDTLNDFKRYIGSYDIYTFLSSSSRDWTYEPFTG